MKNNATLIETNNYYGIFSALIKALDGKTTGLKGKNLIFCEEKRLNNENSSVIV